MIAAHHLIFGKKYGGLFKIPFGNCNRYTFEISTRVGNLTIKMPNGDVINYNTSKMVDTTININNFNRIVRSYPSPYPQQEIEITSANGNSDVYSIYFNWANAQYNDNYNIQNLGTFLAQFPNLYSINYDIYAYGNNANRPTIKGNLFALPKSVTRVHVGNLDVINRYNDTYGNFDSFTNDMQLTYFNDVDSFVSGGSKYYGDLAKTPPLVNFLKITATNNSSLTYTAGRTWASSFDTLDLGNASLSATDTDNLLIDMANSITTAIGSKIIRLANCYRTSASNSAVAYLQSLGFTITVSLSIDTSAILYSEINGVNAYLPLNQNGKLSLTTDRKGGNSAVQFGSGYLATTNNLPISNIWSVSFWIKETNANTIRGFIFELSTNLDNNNGTFSCEINKITNNQFAAVTKFSEGYNEERILLTPDVWNHIVLIYNPSNTASDEITTYINGTLASTNQTSLANSTGSFQSFKLYIGARSGNTFILNAVLDDIRLFNRVLTPTEITNLYNE